jgi:transcriptional regulator GlxA family with amidase domain
MRRITVLLLNGGMASTAIWPIEIFRCAGRLWNALQGIAQQPLFDVVTASIDGKPVRTDDQLGLAPSRSFAEVGTPELVFVPASGLDLDSLLAKGFSIDEALAANPGVTDWLRRWADEGAAIASVCSGVALVATAGLLDGKPATTHWGLAEAFRARFPAVDWREDYMVIDGGDRFCGGGINAAADLSLYLVEKYCGREVALQTARALLIEMPRTWQNSFTHFSLRMTHEDAAVLRIQDELQRRYAEDIQLDALAAQYGMSPRNFARRFKQATGDSPLAYLHGLRIAVAKQMLEQGTATVQEIAGAVGYLDLAFFRALFRRHAGMTPAEFRRRFGRQAA